MHVRKLASAHEVSCSTLRQRPATTHTVIQVLSADVHGTLSEQMSDGADNQAMASDSHPIRAATSVCRQRLKACAEYAILNESHWAENQVTEFNLWSSGVGASADDLNCLDKRLREDVPGQQVVLSVLSTLAAWAHQCIELAKAIAHEHALPDRTGSLPDGFSNSVLDGPGRMTLHEAQATIEELLRVLVELEVAIRRAGMISRLRRADRTLDREWETYVELSKHLEFILKIHEACLRRHIPADQCREPFAVSGHEVDASRQGPTAVEQSSSSLRTNDEIDVDIVLDSLSENKIPLRPEQQLLIHANVKRAHRFAFHKRRQEKLDNVKVQNSPATIHVHTQPFPDAPYVAVDRSVQLKPQPSHLADVGAPPSVKSTGTTDHASNHVAGSAIEKVAATARQDRTAGVAATALALRANYPKPPKKTGKCPYCFIPLSIGTDDMSQWKQHASEDLQPYTCYFPGCYQKQPLFATFEQWKLHVLSEDHRRFEGWTCLFCQTLFDASGEEKFLSHLRAKHSEAFEEIYLKRLADVCRRRVTPLLTQCPICSTCEDDWNRRKGFDMMFEWELRTFLEHIGNCMHDFSLRVLPDPNPTTVTGSGQSMGTVSTFDDRSLPPVSLRWSDHEEDGSKIIGLNSLTERTRDYSVTDLGRLQHWVDSAGTLENPNTNLGVTADYAYDEDWSFALENEDWSTTFDNEHWPSTFDNVDWSFTFDNDFARRLHGVLPKGRLHDYPNTVHPCACCSVLVDPVTKHQRTEARLSEIRVASRSCALCKLLVQTAERFYENENENENADLSVVRYREALRLGRKGPSMLRLCSDVEYPLPDKNDIPIGFPVLPEPESATRFALLRGWLEWCDTNHACNQQNARSQGASPTRLIYLGHVDPEVLLLYVPQDNEGVKYTALSHRWGNDPPSRDNPRYCTTDGNIAARLNSFSLSELPKTFRDAVRVTRELGIEYLWIDSLCIIQWNAEDWKREAGRMEDVFASAYCTIAATSAVDSKAGFLARNTSNEYVRAQDATGNEVCVCTHMDDFEKDVQEAELNKRAWVMQERVLAKRTIHFSANQTYWECGEGVHCENLTKMDSSFRKSYFLLDPSFPDRLLRSGKGRTVEFIHFLFQDYSNRGLTEPTDRRVAASGLEARIAGALHSNSKYGIFEKHLHRNLLWQTSDKQTERIVYTNKQEVPSWSWMACSGGIEFMEIPIGLVSWARTLAFDTECDSAALIADVGKFLNCTMKAEGDRCIVLDISTNNEAGWIRYDIESGAEGSESHCVVVGRTEDDNAAQQYYVLVVVPTKKGGEYRRVGVGKVGTGCVERLGSDVRIV